MFCDDVQEFVSQKGVEFADRDVSKDPEALQELTGVHHVFTTPAIMVGGELAVGFDRERLEEPLAEAAD